MDAGSDRERDESSGLRRSEPHQSSASRGHVEEVGDDEGGAGGNDAGEPRRCEADEGDATTDIRGGGQFGNDSKTKRAVKKAPRVSWTNVMISALIASKAEYHADVGRAFERQEEAGAMEEGVRDLQQETCFSRRHNAETSCQ